MPMIAIPAHFNGEHICLDEPFDLKCNSKVIVTVLPQEDDEEREAWLRVSAMKLSEAYGKDEPEYSLDLLKEVNPDYEGR